MLRGRVQVCGALVLMMAACGGGASTTGAGGAGGGTGGGGAAPPSEVTCDGASLYQTPDDPSARGPWPVGAKTVTVAGLTTEVWYPAKRGSEGGQTKARYDLRLQLPDAEQGKIPDADNPWQECDCYRDLPLDDGHGPYPLVLFIHGTAGFRSQSLTFMTHWASRGFVVVSSDHPGIMLKDVLAFNFSPNQAAEAGLVLDALAAPSGDLAFLQGHLAQGKIAMSGHSAGGGAVEGFGDRAKVIMPMAAGGVNAGAALSSSLVLGAQNDGIVAYSNQMSGYNDTPAKKRLVGIANAGHLAFSDLCFIGRDQGGILQVAIDHGVNVSPLIAQLADDGCKDGQLSAEDGWAIVNYASAAVLEETLACSASAADKLKGIQTTFPSVADYLEAL